MFTRIHRAAIRAVAGLLLAFPLTALAQAPLPIRIGAANATDHAAAFIGVEKGIFAKHGLDAKIVMYQTGPEMINGLLNNQQDVNIMGSIPFLAGVSRDQPLVLIGHLHGVIAMHSLQCLNEEHSVVIVAVNAVVSVDTLSLEQKLPLHRGNLPLAPHRASHTINSDRRVALYKYEEGPATNQERGKTLAVRFRRHNAIAD